MYKTNSDITIIIKTFNRKESLIKMLKSIRDSNIKYPIAIADDSEVPYKDEVLSMFPDMKITYYVLPFDSGLSYGRNFLLKNIDTELFLLCDDDFCFDKRTNIERAKELLDKYSVDILSGAIYNFFKVSSTIDKILMYTQHIYSKGFLQTYVGKFILEPRKVTINIKTRVRDEFSYADTVHNFFLGRKTPILKMGGWDETLKLYEHEEFFLRAKSNALMVAHSGAWGVRHYPVITKHYAKYRFRSPELLYLFNKFNVDEWVQIVDNGSTFIKRINGSDIINERIFHNNIRGKIRKLYNLLRDHK